MTWYEYAILAFLVVCQLWTNARIEGILARLRILERNHVAPHHVWGFEQQKNSDG